MNSFLNLFLCFAIFTIAECMTPEMRERIMGLHNECKGQTGVTDEVLNKAMEGDFPDSQDFKDHMLCFAKKVGFQNEAGELQPDVIKEKLKMCTTDEAKINEVMSKCLIQKSTPAETAAEMSKCMYAIEHS